MSEEMNMNSLKSRAIGTAAAAAIALTALNQPAAANGRYHNTAGAAAAAVAVFGTLAAIIAAIPLGRPHRRGSSINGARRP